MAEENGTLSQYLLGRLPLERRAPLEERLLTDAAFYDDLSIAEDELIDRYLAGDLTGDERRGFETHFLLPLERRRKLRFARALRRYVTVEAAARNEPREDADQPAAQPAFAAARPRRNPFTLPFTSRPALAFSVAAALLVSAAVLSFVIIGRRPPEQRNVYAVTLPPGLVRESGELKRIVVPPGADTLRLQLMLPADDHPAYRAEFQTPEGRTVHTSDNLKSRDADGGRAVEADAPTGVLAAGDYQVRLGGLGDGGDSATVSRYYFRVARQ